MESCLVWRMVEGVDRPSRHSWNCCCNALVRGHRAAWTEERCELSCCPAVPRLALRPVEFRALFDYRWRVGYEKTSRSVPKGTPGKNGYQLVF